MNGFERHLDLVIAAEGGYRVTNVEGDRGGQTCAGIARRRNPKWAGWARIDAGEPPTTSAMKHLIARFYRVEFWDLLNCDRMADDKVAGLVFSCGVNCGQATTARMVQRVVEAEVDGVLGPKTLEAVNGCNTAYFIGLFTMARVARYTAIVERDPGQRKFFYGWIRRAMREAS